MWKKLETEISTFKGTNDVEQTENDHIHYAFCAHYFTNSSAPTCFMFKTFFYWGYKKIMTNTGKSL